MPYWEDPRSPIKPQFVRLVDVALIGPIMVTAALLLPAKYNLIRWTLGAFGVSTIVYNARNLVEIASTQR